MILQFVLSFLLLAAAADAQGTKACTNHPTGYCVNIFLSSCPAGTFFSYSGCGFLEQCCYPPETTAGPTVSPSTATCGVPDYNSGTKIVGGTATDIEKYPWQISLQFQGQHICGGSIISDRWIMTAAHCINEFDFTVYVDDFTIVAGSTYQDNFNRLTNYYELDEILTHSGYVNNERNDIALLKTKTPIDLSGPTKKAVCLPNAGDDFSGQVCVVTGWGAIAEADQFGNQPPAESRLREVSIPVVNHQLCEYYLGSLHSSVLCAGLKAGGKDSCQGDSGGPLVCQETSGIWKQVGIVSFGYGCARAELYGAYTDVSKFRVWIQDMMDKYP